MGTLLGFSVGLNALKGDPEDVGTCPWMSEASQMLPGSRFCDAIKRYWLDSAGVGFCSYLFSAPWFKIRPAEQQQQS